MSKFTGDARGGRAPPAPGRLYRGRGSVIPVPSASDAPRYLLFAQTRSVCPARHPNNRPALEFHQSGCA